jgi:hypothetical protein
VHNHILKACASQAFICSKDPVSCPVKCQESFKVLPVMANDAMTPPDSIMRSFPFANVPRAFASFATVSVPPAAYLAAHADDSCDW